MKKVPSLNLKPYTSFFWIIALFATSSLISAQSYPQPTLFYNFDNPNEATVASANSSGNLNFSSYIYVEDVGVVISPRYTAGGGGVSGQSTDRALDLSNATGMGGITNRGGGAVSDGGLNSVPGFGNALSFTFAGWFYATESSITANAQLINVSNGNTNGFRLSGTNSGGLQLDYVGSEERVSYNSASGAYSAVGEWVFFAVTVDTTIAEGNNVFFYSVDSNGDLVVNASHRTDSGTLTLGSRSVVFGNFTGNPEPATTRPFQGYMDNIAMWADNEAGSDGALTLEQLNAFRMSTIPEPEHFAMAGGLLLLAWAVWRRRK